MEGGPSSTRELSRFLAQAPWIRPDWDQCLTQPGEHCFYPVFVGSSLPAAGLLVNLRLESHQGAGDRAASFGIIESRRHTVLIQDAHAAIIPKVVVT